MSIDPTSQASDYLILLDNIDEASMQRLQEDAESIYGSPWGLPLRVFFAILEDDYSHIGIEKRDFINATVRQYVWMKSFRECEKQLSEMLQAWQVPQTTEAQRASAKCLKMQPKEGVIVFTRKYFNLPNFDATMDIPLSDFVLAKKDEFNNALFRYHMEQQQRAKLQQKKKR